MVCTAYSSPAPRGPRWHKVFLAMLPKIVNHARVAFRHLKGEDMTAWLDGYALGELWEKNVLGARP